MGPIRSVPMCLPQRSSYRMGHGVGGMARHTCRAPRPTVVVTLGLTRVPPWRVFIGDSGHDERNSMVFERGLLSRFYCESNSVNVCARRLWLKLELDAVLVLVGFR